jgi:hypothetical protein
MDGPEEDDPLTGNVEVVLPTIEIIVMMEGVRLTIYVGICL